VRNRPLAVKHGPPAGASPPSRRLLTIRDWLARQSLLRNSGYIMLTTGINSALGYVFWIVVARSYPAAAIGVGAALIIAMTFVAAVANFGTSPALIQRLPRARDDDDWSQIVSTSVITGAAAGLAIALVCALVVLPSVSHSLAVAGANVWYALLFASGVAIWSVSLIADYLFIAEHRSENMTLRNLAWLPSRCSCASWMSAASRRRLPEFAGAQAERSGPVVAQLRRRDARRLRARGARRRARGGLGVHRRPRRLRAVLSHALAPWR